MASLLEALAERLGVGAVTRLQAVDTDGRLMIFSSDTSDVAEIRLTCDELTRYLTGESLDAIGIEMVDGALARKEA
jgi:hypothetical protein